MKKKVSSMILSAVLAAMMTVSVFPSSRSISAAGDMNAANTAAADTKAVTDAEKTKLSFNETKLKEIIGKFSKTYDENSSVNFIYIKKYYVENNYVEQNEQTIGDSFESVDLFSNSSEEANNLINKIKGINIIGYFVGSNGKYNGSVSVNKQLVITDIKFIIYDAKNNMVRWKTIEEVFPEKYDITALKEYIKSTKTNPAARPTATIKPCTVGIQVNSEDMTILNGEDYPVLSYDENQDQAMEDNEGEPDEGKFWILESDHGKVESLKTRYSGNFEFTFTPGKPVEAKLSGIIDDSGKDITKAKNNNYKFEVVDKTNEQVYFNIEKYSAPEGTITPELFCKEENGEVKTYVRLKAKAGFGLAVDNEADSWEGTIELPLDNDEQASYYVRNLDTKAVTDKQTYRAVPDITSTVTVKTENEDGSLGNDIHVWKKENGHSVFAASREIVINTELKADYPAEVAVTLQSTGLNSEVIISPSEWEKDSSGYKVNVPIKLPVSENNSVTIYKDISITIESQNGSPKTNDRLQFFAADGKTYIRTGAEFCIDMNKPEMSSSVEGNNSNIYKVTLTDDTEIVSVDYAWDDLSYVNGSWQKTDEQKGQVFVKGTNLFKNNGYTYSFDIKKFPVNIDGISSIYNYGVKDGRHILHLRVTDAAGNVLKADVQPAEGTDTKAPIVNGVYFAVAGADGDNVELVDASKLSNNEGVYYFNKKLVLLIDAEDDKSEDSWVSGIDYVEFNKVRISGEPNYTAIVDGTQRQYYKFDIPEGIETELSFVLRDKAGNQKQTRAAVYLASDIEKMLVDVVSPKIDRTILDGFVKRNGIDWYGAKLKGTSFEFMVEDKAEGSSGLDNVSIDHYLDGSRITDNGKIKFISDTKRKVTIPFADLADGKHTVVITASDRAGNVSSETYNFYIDFGKPADLVINAADAQMIDGELWYDADKVITVTGTVDEKNIADIEVEINGAEKKVLHYTPDNTDKSMRIIKKGTTNTVVFKLDNNEIAVSEKQTYQITIKAVDKAGNMSKSNTLTLHRDFNAPKITKVVVSKALAADVEKTLKRLTFGLFTNSVGLIITVHSNDIEGAYKYDSGIKELKVRYKDTQDASGKYITTMIMPTDKSKGTFVIMLSSELPVYKSELQIVVFDKFGKSSMVVAEDGKQQYPDIDGTQDNYIMIEQKAPEAAITLAKSDSDGLTGSKYWYRSPKDIMLKVRDVDSGINNIDLFVNGTQVDTDKDGNKLLKSSYTEGYSERINGIKTYTFSTEQLQSLAKKGDGAYVLKVVVTDNSGNVIEEKAEYNIDTTAPTVEKYSFSIKDVNKKDSIDKFVEVMSYGFYFREEFTITVKCNDKTPSSGVKGIDYKLISYADPKKPVKLLSEYTADGWFNVPKGFKGQILVRVHDNAGNESDFVSPDAFVIDTEEVHNRTSHISVTSLPDTNFKDKNNNRIYDRSVGLTAVITDDISGIFSITYEMSSENTGKNKKIITIENNNNKYKVGYELGDGWYIRAMDNNLVTKVEKKFSFEKDDNDILLSFSMKDRAGNISKYTKMDSFSIDKTAPIIVVDFAGESSVYNQERKAVITVTERNFDESKIKPVVNNSYNGNKPSIKFNLVSGTKDQYRAEFIFTEGDYTFSISGEDRSGHKASVKYNKADSKEFRVDNTDPVFSGFTDIASLGNQNVEVTLTVTEHNFDKGKIKVTVTDSLNTLNNPVDWNSDGDVHTMTLPFTEDGVYQISISGEDKAGRKLAEQKSKTFEIDKTAPEISLTFDNNDGNVYNEKRTGKVTVTERNFDAKNVSLKYNKDVTITISEWKSDGDKHTGTFTLGEGDYSKYILSAQDTAGNENQEKQNAAFNVDSKNPDFSGFSGLENVASPGNQDVEVTLKITEHNFDKNKIKVTVTNSLNNTSNNPDNWNSDGDDHTMTLPFTEDGVYQISISGEDKAGRKLAAQTSKTFEIDKTAPVISSANTSTQILSSKEISGNEKPKKFDPIVIKDRNLNKYKIKLEKYILSGDDRDSKVVAEVSQSEVPDEKNTSLDQTEITIDPNTYLEMKDEKAKETEDEKAKEMEDEKAKETENKKAKQGIYIFELTASDSVGNEYSVKKDGNEDKLFVRYYVVMDDDFVVCLPNYKELNNKMKLDNIPDLSLEIFSKKEKNIFSYNAELSENDPFSISDVEDWEEEIIGNIYHYNVHFNKEEFVKKLNELKGNRETGSDYKVNLKLSATAGDDNKTADLGTIDIDTQPPKCEFDSKMQNVQKWYLVDGYYGALPAEVKIEQVPEDIDIDNCEFIDNANTMKRKTDKNSEGDYWYDENGTIYLYLQTQGEHKLSITLKDKAGNEQIMEMDRTHPIYVGSFMNRWWIAFVIGGVIIAGVVVAIIVAVTRRKKTKKQSI